MTVKELIELLSKYPEETVIVKDSNDNIDLKFVNKYIDGKYLPEVHIVITR